MVVMRMHAHIYENWQDIHIPQKNPLVVNVLAAILSTIQPWWQHRWRYLHCCGIRNGGWKTDTHTQ